MERSSKDWLNFLGKACCESEARHGMNQVRKILAMISRLFSIRVFVTDSFFDGFER